MHLDRECGIINAVWVCDSYKATHSGIAAARLWVYFRGIVP
ncbi:hypothetical protein RUMCAL_01969 [Ruminococcus callidus ATCC 27760]|uniref:Uncharacterized protein n=1 Tax=Ruminococcus callidus ATCC 27760 TaxID=411473 RepID=U2M5W3_9FIRM|nr:hypothetical protein RUMCAL_01969 [Ruminococcus callidus ATCC 27760]